MLFFKRLEKLKKKQSTTTAQFIEPKNDYDSQFFSKDIIINSDNPIDKSIMLLIEKIGSPFPEFKLSTEDIRYIDENSHTKSGIAFLTLKIFQHLELPFLDYEVMITVGNSRRRDVFTVDKNGNVAKYTPNDGNAGVYTSYQVNSRITINIEDYYPLNTIIAITCHECMHHFLRQKHIGFSDTMQNEILTDTATIYMGMGAYLQKGYAPITLEIDSTRRRIITVGYIKPNEIKAAHHKIKLILAKYDQEQKKKSMVAQLAEQANSLFTVFREVHARYDSCFTSILHKEDAKLSTEDFVRLQEWIMSADLDRIEEQKLQQEIQAIKTQVDFDNFAAHMDTLCTDFTKRISVLSKYL